jgi:hypothetical protein
LHGNHPTEKTSIGDAVKLLNDVADMDGH